MAIRYNSCVKEGWDYTEGKWIVSLLNTGGKLSGHAVIVVERVESAIPSVSQYDLKSKMIVDETYGDTVQRTTGNAQGYIAEIRVIPNITRDYKNYPGKCWYAEPADVKKMIDSIEKAKKEIEEGHDRGVLPKYQSGGSERWWWLGGNRGDNCVTWAEKQLIVANIKNEGHILDSLKASPQLAVNPSDCQLF